MKLRTLATVPTSAPPSFLVADPAQKRAPGKRTSTQKTRVGFFGVSRYGRARQVRPQVANTRQVAALRAKKPCRVCASWGLDIAKTLSDAGGVGALLQIADHASGKTFLPCYDGNGNVVALLNASTGAAAAVYEWSPFGEALRADVLDPVVADQPFRFSTKFFDGETGLYDYGHRYYSPSQGRFLGRDPIEEKGGLHLYAFCANNPINLWDLLGMDPPGSTPAQYLPGGGYGYINRTAGSGYTSIGGPSGSAYSPTFFASVPIVNGADLSGSSGSSSYTYMGNTYIKGYGVNGYGGYLNGVGSYSNSTGSAGSSLFNYQIGAAPLMFLGSGSQAPNNSNIVSNWAQAGLFIDFVSIYQGINKAANYVGEQFTWLQSKATQVDPSLGLLVSTAGAVFMTVGGEGAGAAKSINIGSLSVAGNIATYDVSLIVGDSATILSGLRGVTQQASAAGADTLVINTGHVVNENLAASLMSRAQSGTTLFGGVVEVTFEDPKAPIFKITIPIPPPHE